jgi:hypothetical protein
VDDPGFQWESGQLCLINFQKGCTTVKKLFSVLVIAGFLAGLGCGGDSGTAKKDTAKEKAGGSTMDKKEKAGGGMGDKKDKDKKDE